MGDQVAFSIVLEDIISVFFPTAYGEKFSNWLTKLIEDVEKIDDGNRDKVNIAEELEKLYETKTTTNG